MAERPAVNTSPLDFLSRAGLLKLLNVAAEHVVVPTAVMEEISAKGPSDVTVRAVMEADWLDVVETPPVPPSIQAWDLGKGESSVLAWGQMHPGTEVIIDDLSARRCAASLGIPVRGGSRFGSGGQETRGNHSGSPCNRPVAPIRHVPLGSACRRGSLLGR